MKISDFNITGKPIPEDVVDKIEKYHLQPLRFVDACLPFDVVVSAKSAYRPRWYELERGRSGNSQHCFKGKGAVDITCENFQQNKEALIEVLVDETQYSRIAIYNTFLHLDYAIQDERWLFDSRWRRIKRLDDVPVE